MRFNIAMQEVRQQVRDHGETSPKMGYYEYMRKHKDYKSFSKSPEWIYLMDIWQYLTDT